MDAGQIRVAAPMSDQSVITSFGYIHASVFDQIKGMSYSKANKWLRWFGFEGAERDEIIRITKQRFGLQDLPTKSNWWDSIYAIKP